MQLALEYEKETALMANTLWSILANFPLAMAEAEKGWENFLLPLSMRVMHASEGCDLITVE